MNPVVIILRRELASYFATPIAYVVLALATAVVFQLIAALRRRRPRASEQGA